MPIRNKKSNDEIIKEAVERYETCTAACSEIRQTMIDDLYFLSGEQWDAKEKDERIKKKRPTLVFNRLPTYVNQVVNQARQNQLAIRVRAFEDNDQNTADVINGLIKHIYNNSGSKAAVDTAHTYQVQCGVGWFRIITDYIYDDSFDQEIQLARIANPRSVIAPLHLMEEIDGCDMPYCFIITKISKEEYKKKYPDAALDNFVSKEVQKAWVTEDEMIIAEYFTIEEGEPYTIYRLPDGTELKELPEGIAAEASKTITPKIVKWYKLSAVEVLEETVFPGKYIPVIPVFGQELNIDGNKQFLSLIRFAKDPQKGLNYVVSNQVERISLSPKSPFIAADGQIEKYDTMWKNANTENYAVLPYSPTSHSGQLVPPPIRQEPVSIDPGLVEFKAACVDEIKAETGIFDASLGARSNETSGRAINARAIQGETANFHFLDNLALSIKHAGRIIVDIIPQIYDVPRTIRILGNDDSEKVVMVNQAYIDPSTQKETLYDLTAGRYDVVVDVGPNFATKRQEANANLTEIAKSVPVLGEVGADMLVRTIDYAGSADLADRLKKLIAQKYPFIFNKDQEQQNAEAEMAALVQDMQKLMMKDQAQTQQMSQMQQIIQRLEQELFKTKTALDDKSEQNQIEMDKAVIKAETDIKKAQIQASPNIMKAMNDLRMQLANIVTAGGSAGNDENNPEPARNAGE